MTASSRQVLLSGIPADMSNESLLLFFERCRFCRREQVERVEFNLQTLTAAVTFCDSEGITSVLCSL